MAIDETHAQLFQAEAAKRGLNLPCPRCRNTQFELQGYSFKRYSEQAGDFDLLGTVFPTFLSVCSNCGFIAEHAAHVLGIKIDPLPPKR